MKGLPKIRIVRTETMEFIFTYEVPRDCKVVYARFCFNCMLHKEEKYQFRITVGGYIIDYPGEVFKKMVDITTM